MTEVGDGVAVVVDDRSDHESRTVDPVDLAALLEASLRDCGVSGPAEVGLHFVDVDEMQTLNIEHMGGTGPTDVLAFPIDGAVDAPAGQLSLIGDIVICVEVAARSAQPLSDELALLVVHGALHLLGHDHAEPDETVVMKALEQKLLAAHWSADVA